MSASLRFSVGGATAAGCGFTASVSTSIDTIAALSGAQLPSPTTEEAAAAWMRRANMLNAMDVVWPASMQGGVRVAVHASTPIASHLVSTRAQRRPAIPNPVTHHLAPIHSCRRHSRTRCSCEGSKDTAGAHAHGKCVHAMRQPASCCLSTCTSACCCFERELRWPRRMVWLARTRARRRSMPYTLSPCSATFAQLTIVLELCACRHACVLVCVRWLSVVDRDRAANFHFQISSGRPRFWDARCQAKAAAGHQGASRGLAKLSSVASRAGSWLRDRTSSTPCLRLPWHNLRQRVTTT